MFKELSFLCSTDGKEWNLAGATKKYFGGQLETTLEELSIEIQWDAANQRLGPQIDVFWRLCGSAKTVTQCNCFPSWNTKPLSHIYQ